MRWSRFRRRRRSGLWSSHSPIVEQYEALQEAAERQHAVAAALASVRAEGLEPGVEDLALFAEVAARRLSTDELRERVLSRYRR